MTQHVTGRDPPLEDRKRDALGQKRFVGLDLTLAEIAVRHDT
jgi:hypothetical protein